MGVIDLNTRITKDWCSYCENVKSSDSLIFIDPLKSLEDEKLPCIDLTVGDRCFYVKENKYYDIPGDGIHIKAFTSILVESEQRVVLPFNIFGLVTGKGNQIFQGAFISTGKINPGYDGKLKIGFFNGSNDVITIKKGDPLCSCVFLEMESCMKLPNKFKDDKFQKATYLYTKNQMFRLWFAKNKGLLTILFSLVALIIALLTMLLNKDFVLYKK